MKNRKYAFIGDKPYCDVLSKEINVKHYSNAFELYNDLSGFNPDVILLMVNYKPVHHKRSDYFGLTETLPALRFSFRITIPVILLGFENADVLNEKYLINSFLNDDNALEAYLQLPFNCSDIEKCFISGTPKFDLKIYLPFVKKSRFLANLIHKHSNSKNPEIKKLIALIEGLENGTIAESNKLTIENDNIQEEQLNFCSVVNVLIIDDSKEFSITLKNAFNKIKAGFESQLNIKINFISTQYVKSFEQYKGVMEILKADGDFQIVLLDWQLEDPGNKSTETLYQKANIKEDLVKEILGFRPDLHIYTMTAYSESAKEIGKMQENVISFFFKEEMLNDPQSTMDRIFLKNFKNKMSAPFWDTYRKYIESATDTWHPPGHSRGKSFFNSPYLRDFYNYWKRNVFTGDLSFGVHDIGFLDESNGSIGEAQKVAASTFGAKHTFFITNGTSTSNKVVMQSVLKPGDKVIIDRNCHKSNHYGFLLANAHPVYLETQYIKEYSFFAAPSMDEIVSKVKSNPDAKLLILTGSNYEGIVINTKEIVKKVKEINPKIKIFVDEAWFGYSYFHPDMRDYSAVFGKADYVTQSSHKVLSAFSQASVIHINDPDFDKKENEDFFRDIYQIYLSTSPQYQIISSLDICSLQMRMEGFKLLDNLIKLSKVFCAEIKSFENNSIKVVDEIELAKVNPNWKKDKLFKDPLKVLLDVSQLNYSPEDICIFLNKEAGIEIERRTKSTILVIFSIGTDRSMVYRLIYALKKVVDGRCYIPKKTKQAMQIDFPKENQIVMLPSDAFYSNRKLIEVKKAVGAVSASLVTPYPPGIPLLVFGQLIEQDHVDKIIELCDDPNTNDIHGLKGKKSSKDSDKKIYVVSVNKNSSSENSEISWLEPEQELKIETKTKTTIEPETEKTAKADLTNENVKNIIKTLINDRNENEESYILKHRAVEL